jgi:hypothetical protein
MQPMEHAAVAVAGGGQGSGEPLLLSSDERKLAAVHWVGGVKQFEAPLVVTDWQYGWMG